MSKTTVDELTELELDDEPVELDPFQLFSCGHQERTAYSPEEAKLTLCYQCTVGLESEDDREYTQTIRDSGRDISADYKKAMLPANAFVTDSLGNRHDFFSAGPMEMPGITQRPLLLENETNGWPQALAELKQAKTPIVVPQKESRPLSEYDELNIVAVQHPEYYGNPAKSDNDAPLLEDATYTAAGHKTMMADKERQSAATLRQQLIQEGLAIEAENQQASRDDELIEKAVQRRLAQFGDNPTVQTLLQSTKTAFAKSDALTGELAAGLEVPK